MIQPYKWIERRAKFNSNIDKCVETIYQQPKSCKRYGYNIVQAIVGKTIVRKSLDHCGCVGSTPIEGTGYSDAFY
jgi:hypothetical protein